MITQVRERVGRMLAKQNDYSRLAIEEALRKIYLIDEDEPACEDDEFCNMISELHEDYVERKLTKDDI
jgi:hypothetical protein